MLGKSIYTLLLLFLLGGCGSLTVYNAVSPSFERKISPSEMQQAVVNAAQRYGWEIKNKIPGAVEAEYRRRDFFAQIKISYSASSYSIDYVDSENLKYDGQKIHKAYNSWIKNLEKTLNENLETAKFSNTGSTPISYTAYNNSKSIVSNVTIADPIKVQTAPNKFECKKTFKISGSLMRGRVFTAKHTINNISKSQAVSQAATALVSEGFVVSSTNPEMGFISASETKSAGVVLPINLSFAEAAGDSLTGTITVSTPGGIGSRAEAMKNYMCGVLGKVKSTGYKKQSQAKKSNSSSSVSTEDATARLNKLKKLHTNGLISDTEYKQKKAAILEQI